MNKRIRELMAEVGMSVDYLTNTKQIVLIEKFAELIVRECDQLNQKQSFELTGVVVDVEQGDGFDSVCLDTVKRVESYLADSTLKKHFGVEE